MTDQAKIHDLQDEYGDLVARYQELLYELQEISVQVQEIEREMSVAQDDLPGQLVPQPPDSAPS
ncbi:MAG TPA: hypothetical protein VGQ11_01770, partial [Candidatus Acidoferrales bacterium]|nr:hypothetical protein [Candidatus Acidoferrales bacterium]